MHTSLQPLGECHCWWTRVSPRAHMKPSSTFDFSWFVAFWEQSTFSVLKFIEIVILLIYYMASLLASASFWYFCDISFKLFKLPCLAKNHWWGFCTRSAHMVHIVNEIPFKMVYTSWSFYSSTTPLTWWVSLLVDKRVPEGTFSQVPRSTSVDS